MISPGLTATSTPRSARTPPKRLSMPVRLTSAPAGVVAAAERSELAGVSRLIECDGTRANALGGGRARAPGVARGISRFASTRRPKSAAGGRCTDPELLRRCATGAGGQARNGLGRGLLPAGEIDVRYRGWKLALSQALASAARRPASATPRSLAARRRAAASDPRRA